MKEPDAIPIVTTYSELLALQERIIRGLEPQSDPIEILEAGCGRSWPLRLEGVNYRLTGIDLDRDALKYRTDVMKDLDEAVVGDLRTADFGDRRFNVIYSAFVLEHILGANEVMLRFLGWLQKGGLLIIKVPDPESAHGFLTKMSPHWFHVFYYRYIYGYKDAGKPGHGPYKTYYDHVISRSGMREFCAKNNVQMISEFGISDTTNNRTLKYRIVKLIRRGVGLLTLGRLSGSHNDLLYVLKR